MRTIKISILVLGRSLINGVKFKWKEDWISIGDQTFLYLTPACFSRLVFQQPCGEPYSRFPWTDPLSNIHILCTCCFLHQKSFPQTAPCLPHLNSSSHFRQSSNVTSYKNPSSNDFLWDWTYTCPEQSLIHCSCNHQVYSHRSPIADGEVNT